MKLKPLTLGQSANMRTETDLRESHVNAIDVSCRTQNSSQNHTEGHLNRPQYQITRENSPIQPSRPPASAAVEDQPPVYEDTQDQPPSYENVIGSTQTWFNNRTS